MCVWCVCVMHVWVSQKVPQPAEKNLLWFNTDEIVILKKAFIGVFRQTQIDFSSILEYTGSINNSYLPHYADLQCRES